MRGFGCGGCNGAWPTQAFNYIGSYGLANTVDYPYIATSQTCKDTLTPKTNYLIPSQTYTSITSTSVLSKLSTGPLSICVDASLWSSYRSGILSCRSKVSINHAVVLVGVDTSGNWKVRNSWGIGWGEAGYIRITSNNRYNCGLLNYAFVPNLA